MARTGSNTFASYAFASQTFDATAFRAAPIVYRVAFANRSDFASANDGKPFYYDNATGLMKAWPAGVLLQNITGAAVLANVPSGYGTSQIGWVKIVLPSGFPGVPNGTVGVIPVWVPP